MTIRFRLERQSRTKRPAFLQTHDEIKKFHAPANRETVADVSAQHCIHRRRNLQEIGLGQEHFDEFLARIPRIHEAQVNIHRAINRALITREQAATSSRIIECLMQSIGRFFPGENSEENSAAKDRIDETGGIAREQPAITDELCIAKRKIGRGIDLRDAPALTDAIAEQRLFGQGALEEFLAGSFDFLKSSASHTMPMLVRSPFSGMTQNQLCSVRTIRVSVPSIPLSRSMPA